MARLATPDPRENRRRAAWGLVLLGVLAGCSSAGKEPEAVPYTPPPPVEPDAIGFFLLDFDRSLRAWQNLKFGTLGPDDQRTLRALEREMRYRAAKRMDEVVAELESGSPKNRSVAAAALGFTGEARAQEALLAVLGDPDEEVVHHALLGLGLLARPDTPLGQIAWILRNHPDGWTRSNAAFALLRIVAAESDGGGREDLRDDVAAACREALIDEEPGVRAQSASVLGLLADQEAIEPLGDLLYDDMQLVASAAASSLARIGRHAVRTKGEGARLLVEAYGKADSDAPKERLRQELVRLRGDNLGEELDAWKEWAYRLP